MMQWTFDPHSGGNKISDARKRDVKRRIDSYAKEHLKDKCERIEVTFRSQLCYIYAIEIHQGTKQEMKTPMCRLRHFDLEKWSISLFTWSNEKYEPAMFPKGEWFGTVEEATELGGTFL